MTGELSLLQCFRANTTNLLEYEISQKGTVPDGHRRGDPLTGQSFQALCLGKKRAPALKDLHMGLPVNGDVLV